MKRKLSVKIFAWVLAFATMFAGIPGLENLGLSPVITAEAANVASLPAAGGTLYNGNIYKVTSSTTITNTATGGNGLIVANNATVVIYISKGATLTVRGGDGSTTTPGGAGIYVPSNSTLIVTGEGTLYSYGGQAGNGSKGGNGQAGWLNIGWNQYQGGTGGTGGAGGGGAGAGIGTSGGYGGSAKSGPAGPLDSSDWYHDHSGNDGYRGNTGGNSSDSGRVYILGVVSVYAYAGTYGSKGKAGTSHGGTGDDRGSGWSHNYAAGGGGPGGGGGAGFSASAIGSGGQGAGSGGSGGSGGVYSTSRKNGYAYLYGAGGKGGYGYYNGTDSTLGYTSAGGCRGGSGGASGYSGTKGASGTVYKASSAYCNVSASSASTHDAIKFSTTFLDNKTYPSGSTPGTVEDMPSTVYSYFGSTQYTTATHVSIPTRTGYSFTGFYLEPGCTTQIYDDKGNAVPSTMAIQKLTDSDNRWVSSQNVTLYAGWKANTYSCTLNALGGTGGMSVYQKYDDPITTGISAPVKTGYIFGGYYMVDPATGDEVYYYDANMATTEGERWLIPNNGAVLYAKWIPYEYNIELYSNDDKYSVAGSSGYVETIENSVYGNLILPPAEQFGMEREHYDFIGWNIYDEQNWAMFEPNTPYKTGLTATEPTAVVYAAWQIKDNFTITYYANGGYNGPLNDTVFQGEDYTVSDVVPVNNTYSFVEWNTNPNGSGNSYQPGDEIVAVGENVTLYAIWEKNKNVSYNSNGGIFSSTPAVAYPGKNETVNVIFDEEYVPVRTGYTFLGWSRSQSATAPEYTKSGTTSFTMPENDVILYAIWDINKYTISYTEENSFFKYGEAHPLAVCYKDDYSFDILVNTKAVNTTNMVVTVNDIVFQTPVPEVTDSVAKYTYKMSSVVSEQSVNILGLTEKKYGVTFFENGGTIDSGSFSEYGYSADADKALPTEISKKGYEFGGWYENKDFEGSAVTVIAKESCEDKCFYAKWTPKTYTVAYDINGGSGTVPENFSAVYDTAFMLPKQGEMSYTIGGEAITFLGWSTDINAVNATYLPGQKVKNLYDFGLTEGGETEPEPVLYAVWNVPQYNISYDLNGGKTVSDPGTGSDPYASSIVKAGSSVSVAFDAIEREGYEFGGWTDGTNDYVEGGTENVTVTGDTILTAKWIANEYKINYRIKLSEGYLKDADDEKVVTGKYDANGHKSETGTIDITVTEPEGLMSYVFSVSQTYDSEFDISGLPFSYKKLEEVPEPEEPEEEEPEPEPEIPPEPQYEEVDAGCFIGWSKELDGTVPDYVAGQKTKNVSTGADVALYAIISERDVYFLCYDANGGEWADGSLSAQAGAGGSATVSFTKTPVKEYYTFVGWGTESENPTTVYKADESNVISLTDGNVTLYAVWQPISYKVYYEISELYYTPTGEEGANVTEVTGSTASQTIAYNEYADLNSNGFAYTGYDFIGWATSSDDETVNFKNGAHVKNLSFEYDEEKNEYSITLYCIWEMHNPKSLVFDNNGAPGEPSSQTVAEGSEVEIGTDLIPERSGYVFKGWSVDPEKTVPEYAAVYTEGTVTGFEPSSVKVDSDILLYATWEERTKYSVEYAPAAGAAGSVPFDTATYYEGDSVEVKTNAVPERTGYSFAGWTLGEDTFNAGSSFTVKDSMADDSHVITLTQKLVSNKYEVNFYKDGELLNDEPINLEYDGEVPDISAFAPVSTEFYTFTGWALVDGGEAVYTNDTIKNLTTIDNSSVDLYAVFEPVTCTVSLSNGDATDGEDSVTATYDEQMPVIKKIPTLYGYTFAGYYSLPEGKGTMYYNASMNPVKSCDKGADFTLYAKWTPAEYNIIYMQSGEVCLTQKAYYGSKVAIPGDGICVEGSIVRGTTKLSGWSVTGNKEAHVYKPAELCDMWNLGDGHDIVLYAVVIKDIKYSVTYNANGGTGLPIDAKTYEEDEYADVTYSIIPQRNDYVFMGWSEDPNATEPTYTQTGENNSIKVTRDVVLYAVWKIGTYTITYHPNAMGGKLIGGASDVIEVTRGASAIRHSEEIFELEGYELEGWSTSYSAKNSVAYDLGGSISSTLTALDNFDLYSVWGPASVDVSFDSLGGSFEEPVSVTFDSIYGALPNPTRDGYTFEGWYSEYDIETEEYNGHVVSSTKVTNPETHTLYAKWTENVFTVNYHYNYDEDEVEPYVHNVAERVKILSGDEIKREGYILTGYSATPAGSLAYKTGTVLSAHSFGRDSVLNLYCLWQPVVYKVNFDGNGNDGGVKVASQTFTYDDDTQTLNANTFTNYGYVFVEWNTEPDGSGTGFADMLAAPNVSVNDGEEVTLYAIWAKADVLEVTKDSYEYVYGEDFEAFKKDIKVIARYADGSTSDITDVATIDYSKVNTRIPGTYEVKVKYLVETSINIEVVREGFLSISYLAPDATSGVVPTPVSIVAGKDVKVLGNTGNLAKYGFKFAGWCDDEEGKGTFYNEGDTITAPEESICLYAMWDVCDYSLDLYGDEGIDEDSFEIYTEDGNDTYSFGEEITVMAKVKDGYTWFGYESDNTAYLASDTGYEAEPGVFAYTFEMPGYNTGIKAATAVTLTADANGEFAYFATAGAEKPETLTFSAARGSLLSDITINEPMGENGHYFIDWFLDAECTVEVPADYVLGEDTVIYAGWGYSAGEGELCVLGVSDAVYNAKAVTPEVVVTDGNEILVKGRDYTATYYNNINVNKDRRFVETNALTVTPTTVDDSKVDKKLPYVIVKGKGNYSGTIMMNFNIRPKDISEAGTDDELTMYCDSVLKVNNTKAQKAKVSLVYTPENGKKVTLKSGKQYEVSYVAEGDAEGPNSLQAIPKKSTGNYIMTVKGIGNFTGSFTRTVSVQNNKSTDLAYAKISVGRITMSDNLDVNALPVKVKLAGKNLTCGSDYSLEFADGLPVNPGTYTVTVKATESGAYRGSRNVSVKFAPAAFDAKHVSVTMISGAVYNGRSYGNGIESIKAGSKELVYGKDYTTIVNGGTKAGTATVTIKGLGIYKGKSFKTKYKIAQFDLAANPDGFVKFVTPSGSVEYVKSGAKAPVSIMFGMNELVEGTDYTLTYANNKKVTSKLSAKDKRPTITIKGKGNFKGKVSGGTFDITERVLCEENISVSAKDVVYEAGKKLNVSFTLKDRNGDVKLVAGKDYEKKPVYTCDGHIISAIPEIGSVVTVTVKGIGNYAGDYSFDIDVAGINFAKAKIKATNPVGKKGDIVKTYTGDEIFIEDGDIRVTYKIANEREALYFQEQYTLTDGYVKVGTNMPTNNFSVGDTIYLREGRDYILDDAEYVKNVNKGTATVSINGIGYFGGAKKIKFKISPKDISWL